MWGYFICLGVRVLGFSVLYEHRGGEDDVVCKLKVAV